MKQRSAFVALIVGVGAGLAAAGWLLRDRLLPRATPASEAATRGSDDLTEVKGIGPVYEKRLIAAGISNLDDLIAAGATVVSKATGVVETAGANWIAQAQALQGAR